MSQNQQWFTDLLPGHSDGYSSKVDAYFQKVITCKENYVSTTTDENPKLRRHNTWHRPNSENDQNAMSRAFCGHQVSISYLNEAETLCNLGDPKGTCTYRYVSRVNC